MQQWQRLAPRQRRIVFIVGSVLIVWALDAAALRPLRRQLHHLRGEVHDAEQRLRDAVAAQGQEKGVSEAFAAYEPYVKPAGSSESELAGVLSEVESAVRQAGVVLLSLKPASGRPAPTTNTVSVTVEGESSPSQFVQVLDLIQRSPRLLKVVELTVRVTEAKTLRSSMVISKLLLK